MFDGLERTDQMRRILFVSDPLSAREDAHVQASLECTVRRENFDWKIVTVDAPGRVVGSR